ncbi:unnamed protein product [Knipowitschia caucasica]
MQESKCFSDGDGVEWFSQSKCTDEKMTKRDAKVLLRISKGHMVSDESGRSFSCLHDCTHCWTNKGTQQSTVCPHKALDSCTNPHISPLLPFINSYPWADLTNATYDVYHSSKNLNCNSKEMVVILYKDQFCAQSVYDAGTMGITAPSVNEDVEHLKTPDVPKNKNNNLNHVINNDNSDICEEVKIKPRLKIRRKSVSFADDVIVYLYDKDSPTVRMDPDSSSSSNPLTEVLHDDNSLEWEDDFLALEKNCHPQTHLEPFTFRSANATIPKRQSLVLSQNCLFLTHISEADLEP